jgi:hypothetical protein
MEEIVETLKSISKYQYHTPDDRSGGAWHTIKFKYYPNSYQVLCIHQEGFIRWNNYNHEEPSIDINNPLFIDKINNILERNDDAREKISNKLFQLEEITLMRI